MSDFTPANIQESPSSPPSPKGTHLKEYQLETVAKLSAMNANSPEQISITTGIPLNRINQLMRGENSKFNILQNKYRELVSKHHTGARFNMMEMIPLCNEAIRSALVSEDTRLAKDTAFEIIDRVIPDLNPRAQRSLAGEPGQFNISITHNNPQAVNILNSTMDSVANMMGELKGQLAMEGEFISHELIGEAALPTPPGQLEVGDGLAYPTLEESSQEEWLDLVPMPERQE